MPSLLSFEKPITPLPYTVWVLGIFLSQHVLVLVIFQLYPSLVSVGPDWGLAFALVPLHMLGLRILSSVSVARESGVATPLLIATLLYQLLVTWSVVALSFRRTSDANWPGWIVALAIVPVIQITVFLGLSLAPSRASAPTRPSPKGESATRWTTGTRGLLAGIALTIAAVALSTLVFGSYGYGVFVISQFLVGFTTAAIANARCDLGAADAVVRRCPADRAGWGISVRADGAVRNPQHHYNRRATRPRLGGHREAGAHRWAAAGRR